MSRPPGTLFVVATPIGNLADASPRSIATLREADLVACEDTRTTRTLLAHHGISVDVVALHQHNEKAQSKKLLELLQQGKRIALVSDAGTPGVSDPGALLVEGAHRDGIRVEPLPGPSAALAAYSASGFASDGFLFVGFLEKKGSLDALDVPRAVILYEAPHRVQKTVQALLERFGPEREIVIAREISKKFEEIARMPLGSAPQWLEDGPHRQQGEFVLVLGPAVQRKADAAEGERVRDILAAEMSASDAARLAAKITGVPRNSLYKPK